MGIDPYLIDIAYAFALGLNTSISVSPLGEKQFGLKRLLFAQKSEAISSLRCRFPYPGPPAGRLGSGPHPLPGMGAQPWQALRHW